MKTLKKLFVIATLLPFLVACEEVVSPEVISTADAEELKNDAIQYSQANNSFGGTLNAISTYGISEDLTKTYLKSEPVRTYDSANYIVTLTYPDGGIISIDWDTIPLWTIPNITGVATVTNFRYGGATVNGVLYLTTAGNVQKPTLISTGQLTITVENQNMTFEPNNTFTWEEGFGNHNITNVFSAYGTAKLTVGSKIMNSTIPENKKLFKRQDCDYPHTGIITLAIQDTNKEVITDYGVDQNGNTSTECDSYARLTLKVGNASLTLLVNLAQ